MTNSQVIILCVLGSIAFLMALFIILTYILYKVSVNRGALIGKKVDKEFSSNLEHYGISHEWWVDKNVEKISNVIDGVRLDGYLIRNSSKNNKLAIVIHGYFSSHLDMTYAGDIFFRMGYDVFFPDLRSHGTSEGKTVGMAYLDSKDMLAWIDELINMYNDDIEIAIWGLSMGASTVCMLSGFELPKNVKCLISDCGYSNAYDQFKSMLTSRHIPPHLIMFLTNLGIRIFGGYSLKNADAVKAVKKSTLPMLFIHGDKDDFVPTYMCDEIYNAKEVGFKQKEIFSGAKHGESFVSDKNRYEDLIKSFVNSTIN